MWGEGAGAARRAVDVVRDQRHSAKVVCRAVVLVRKGGAQRGRQMRYGAIGSRRTVLLMRCDVQLVAPCLSAYFAPACATCHMGSDEKSE